MFELNDDWSGGSVKEKELSDALFGSLASSGTSKAKRRKQRKHKQCQQKEQEAQQLLEFEKAVREPTATWDLEPTFREKRRRKASGDEQLISGKMKKIKIIEDDQSASKFAGKKRKIKSSEDEQLTSTFSRKKRKRKLSKEEKDERHLFDAHHRKDMAAHWGGMQGAELNLKRRKQQQLSEAETSTSEASAAPEFSTPKSSKLHSKMASKMEGARFRWINEQLYTTTGDEAKKLFQNEPKLFSVYHQGFATQVSKWPINPLDHVIEYVKSLPLHMAIADFGCGDARLAQSVPHTVHSFDLVACVTACDMAHVSLPSASVDVCVFCLSLMGTNITDFIQEGKRVLKQDGRLKICDVASRFTSVENFAKDVESFGFKLFKTRTLSKMFLDVEFKVTSQVKPSKLPNIQLKPCCYKRR